MSSNLEMKLQEILTDKPYLTKKELRILLDKKGKNLDKKILSLLKKKELVLLKKGLYVSKFYLLKKPDFYEEYLANILYYPSYLSLEYVLSQRGVIPEAVYVYTSVSTRKTRNFQNEIGEFSYRKIKKELFTGYELKEFTGELKIYIATKAKALFDYLYLKPFYSYRKSFEDLRLNLGVLTEQDIKEFYNYVKLSKSKKMKETFRILKNYYDRR